MKATKISLTILMFLTMFVLFTGKPNLVSASSVNIDNGKIIDNRTLVPLRAIFEEIGATVDWDQQTRTVRATKDDTDVILQIDSRSTKVNGKEVIIDVPAMIFDNRTFVPLRFISESFGAEVKWDQETRKATIIYGSNVITVTTSVFTEEDAKKLVEKEFGYEAESLGRFYSNLKPGYFEIYLRVFPDDCGNCLGILLNQWLVGDGQIITSLYDQNYNYNSSYRSIKRRYQP